MRYGHHCTPLCCNRMLRRGVSLKRESGKIATRQPSARGDAGSISAVAIERGWADDSTAPPVELDALAVWTLNSRPRRTQTDHAPITICIFQYGCTRAVSLPGPGRLPALTSRHIFSPQDHSPRRYITPSTTTTAMRLQCFRNDLSSRSRSLRYLPMDSERVGSQRGRRISMVVVPTQR